MHQRQDQDTCGEIGRRAAKLQYPLNICAFIIFHCSIPLIQFYADIDPYPMNLTHMNDSWFK